MAGRRGAKGPAGGEVLREARAAIARGWPPGLVVLTGDDLFHLDLAQRSLLDHLLPGGAADGLSLTVFGERRVAVGAVVAAARSVGMFASRRVVLVRDVEVLEGETVALGAFAANPPEESFLLVRAPKLDPRRTLHKELLAAGRLLAFRTAEGDEGADLVRETTALAKERGLVVDAEVAGFLLAVSALDLYRVVSELDKIAAWKGTEGAGRVTMDEARAVAAGGGALSGWELADAVLARDGATALAAARRLLDAGEQPLRIVGGLAWRARAMLQIRAAIDAGARPEDAARSVWTGVPRDALLAGVRRYRLSELLAFPGRILRADRTLKSRSIDPRAVLEPLVEDLTREPPRSAAQRTR